jgi:uncharacterized phiE125 gp8 family phage protein
MISDALLIAQVNGETEDTATLRKMEQDAIAAIEVRTGRYYGTVAARTEYINWRGGPLQLSNVPISLTSLKSWDGSAFQTVDSTSYYLEGAFIHWNTTQTWTPIRYQVIYQAGYTVDALDANVWPAPRDIQRAVLLTVGHWFRNREGVGEGQSELPLAVTWLLDPNVKVAV